MQIEVKLEPVVETVGLLYFSYHQNHLDDMILNELKGMGVNGAPVYHAHSKMYHQYISAFHKHLPSIPDQSFFFEDDDFELAAIVGAPFLCEEEFTEQVEELEEDVLREKLQEYYNSLLEGNITKIDLTTVEGRIRFVQECELEAKIKWKLLLVLQDPKHYYSRFALLIRAGLEAYPHAVEAVQAPLKRLLKRFPTQPEFWSGHPIWGKTQIIERVRPSLIFSFGQMMLLDTCYYGLLWEELYRATICPNEVEGMLSILKAISDKSKLEILLQLKKAPKYSQELAQQLQLTPATISHHMDTLLSRGLVSIAKTDGRLYFQLNDGAIRELIDSLQKLFL